jgi:membrane-associated protein
LSSIAAGLAHLNGWLAYLVIAALVFGETAIFLGFVLPGEAAAVLGGVLASRGQVSIVPLVTVVVIGAIVGPVVGYEIGRRMGDRLFAARVLGRIPGGVARARSTLQARGGLGVLIGRFVAILRALVPAAAGAAQVPYRTFFFFNAAGGIIWGVGYCLLGYLAGSAYVAVEKRVGTGLAVVIAALALAAVGTWAVRRHRAAGAGAANGGAAAGGAAAGGAAGGGAAGGGAAGGGAAGGGAAGGGAAAGGAAGGGAANGGAADGGHPGGGQPDSR